jgi:endogenous inhibitor of DNA gyrase (YacG/DUF329 family)
MNHPMEVACPQCGKKVIWNKAHTYRPFCSERCKMVDLGLWASGRYSIPVQDDRVDEVIAKDNSSDSTS